jgi:hypothetical protein
VRRSLFPLQQYQFDTKISSDLPGHRLTSANPMLQRLFAANPSSMAQIMFVLSTRTQLKSNKNNEIYILDKKWLNQISQQLLIHSLEIVIDMHMLQDCTMKTNKFVNP